MKLKIISYNILANNLANPDYIKVNKKYLDNTYRIKILKKKIIDEIENNTIFCLQEVSNKQLASLHIFLSKYKYKFVNVNELAILFPYEKFIINNLELGLIYDELRDMIPTKHHKLLNSKKKHFIILSLSDINKKRSFTIATTHLIASPELDDLKLLQIYCILKKLDKYNNIILAGDFNSKPDSDVYKLITSKPLKNKLGTFKTKNKYKITHESNLITTHTKNLNSDVFTATIDYIVVQDNIVVEKTSKLYDISKYNEKNLAPNISESSDHFMISAYVHL